MAVSLKIQFVIRPHRFRKNVLPVVLEAIFPQLMIYLYEQGEINYETSKRKKKKWIGCFEDMQYDKDSDTFLCKMAEHCTFQAEEPGKVKPAIRATSASTPAPNVPVARCARNV